MINKVLSDYQRMTKEAIDLANKVQFTISKPDNLIFAGMGGSGAAGNLIKDILQDDIDVPIEIVKGYDLPNYINENSLVFCTSYSGNTEETLSQFVKAVKKNCSIFCVSSGGKLIEWSKKLNITFVQVPGGYQPRESLPYLFFPLLIAVQKVFKIDLSNNVKEFLDLLNNIDTVSLDNLAVKIKDSFPAIYGPSNFSGALRRIKSQLNENCKIHTKFEELPELNHNEVVAYEIFSNDNITPIFIRDKDEEDVIRRRVEITKDIVSSKVKVLHEIWTYGNSKLAKVMSLVYQGDYLSLKLAELRKVNWEQTKTIDRLKEELKALKVVEKLERELNSMMH